ncbi:MAG TPA: S9 family peptidase [Methylomirabilota bacterium]|jgi:oligopeptidase B
MIPPPPAAERRPRSLEIHGDRLEDPYYWLREKDNPDVTAYLQAENAYTDAVMKDTEAFQQALYAEMLARIKEDDVSVPYRRGRHFYYARTETGKQYPIYCRKAERLDAAEQVVLDLNVLAAGHPFFSLGAYTVSDDGRWLAYSTDVTGFREYTLAIKDLETDTLLDVRVEKVSSVAWPADPTVLFYVTEDDAKRPYRAWRHRLPADARELIYEEADALFRVGVGRSRSLAWLFMASRSFQSSEWRCLPATAVDGVWRLVHPREKEHEYDIDHRGDRFWIRTNGEGRRNFRLVTAPVDTPEAAHWTEEIAHREEVMLEELDVFAHHAVLHEREDGLIRLRVLDLDTGGSHHVAFPEPTYEVSGDANAEFDVRTYRFRYQSLVTPASVYDYTMDTRVLTLLKQTPVLGGYDPGLYRSERRYAIASDGTRVPISLVHRADSPPDPTRPMLLTGYGAYGLPYPVTFSSNRLSLLDRGVSFAIAHIRGGGEGGKRWHDAGRLKNKPNTFTDFIAAADHLVAHQYTTHQQLVIEGGSAGGLLIGAVMNRRPDLATAAVLRVPFVDVVNTMLDESLPLTVGEFEEWGNPKEREYYDVIKTYCPYTNLDALHYPRLLVRTSLNDSQVMYWEPAKYVAKLRYVSPGTSALFRINMAAGHGGASGRYDYLREIAFDYAFVLTRLGRHS